MHVLFCNPGKPWLEAPWLYGEFYLYRRVIEAFQWFRGGADPFAAQKQAGVTSALSSMEALAARLLEADKLVSTIVYTSVCTTVYL
jgi:Damage-control phosphatase ARMT1-like domain